MKNVYLLVEIINLEILVKIINVNLVIYNAYNAGTNKINYI